MITLIEKYLTAQLYAGQAALLNEDEVFSNAHRQYTESLAYFVHETQETGEMVDMQAILKTAAKEACSYASESFIQPSIPATVLREMDREIQKELEELYEAASLAGKHHILALANASSERVEEYLELMEDEENEE
jgi:hypothetical protein